MTVISESQDVEKYRQILDDSLMQREPLDCEGWEIPDFVPIHHTKPSNLRLYLPCGIRGCKAGMLVLGKDHWNDYNGLISMFSSASIGNKQRELYFRGSVRWWGEYYQGDNCFTSYRIGSLRGGLDFQARKHWYNDHGLLYSGHPSDFQETLKPSYAEKEMSIERMRDIIDLYQRLITNKSRAQFKIDFPYKKSNQVVFPKPVLWSIPNTRDVIAQMCSYGHPEAVSLAGGLREVGSKFCGLLELIYDITTSTIDFNNKELNKGKPMSLAGFGWYPRYPRRKSEPETYIKLLINGIPAHLHYDWCGDFFLKNGWRDAQHHPSGREIAHMIYGSAPPSSVGGANKLDLDMWKNNLKAWLLSNMTK